MRPTWSSGSATNPGSGKRVRSRGVARRPPKVPFGAAEWNGRTTPAEPSSGPAHRIHLHVWRDPPRREQGGRARVSWCNTEAMPLHLAQTSARVAPARHATLVVDEVGWPLSERLVVPANITIVPLPGKCPELNPRENVGNSHETTGCRTGCSPSTPKSSTTRARSARVMSAHPARQPERRLDSSNRIRRVETPA